MKKTKIVCTIGPATENVETLKEMIYKGMNVARFNFSHGDFEDQEKYINAVKEATKETNMPVALLLDTQGPEIRTGKLKESPVILKAEEEFILVNDDIIGDNTKVSVTYKDLYKDVKPGITILIDDGKIEIEVDRNEKKNVVCKVMNGGELGNRKSINVPGTHINLPALKEKDIKDLKDGCKADFDYIAASFIRSKDDVLAIRKVLDENGGMVARGDMGVEIPMEQVPIVQKELIKKCNKAGKIVITATQMLESMTVNPRPTRAEVSDVANAVFDGTCATMLSGESAMGKYPVTCVEIMSNIAKAVEESINYEKRFNKKDVYLKNKNYEYYLAHSICSAAFQMNAKAIFAYTECGDTPKIISSFMPKCPIYAVTKSEKTYRSLSLIWGVFPILVNEDGEAKEIISKGIEIAKEKGYVKDDDVVAIAGGDTVLPDNKKDFMNRTIGGVIRI